MTKKEFQYRVLLSNAVDLAYEQKKIHVAQRNCLLKMINDHKVLNKEISLKLEMFISYNKQLKNKTL